VETLVAEPEKDAFDTVEKLCEEYGINVSLHNHPKASPWPAYWSPDIVLEVCQGRSKRIGACADTGHWSRSGLDALECLKKLEGRIISFHLKDINEISADSHDVPWGTGASNLEEMLAEIYRQKVKAVFSIEYEYNWENSLPDIAQSIAFFDKVAAELAAGGAHAEVQKP
jgi:sugar phosphate isomerase/epimerase